MTTTYRRLAEVSLEEAISQLRQLPPGRVRTDEMLACSANVQARATIGLIQALLYLGDVLQQNANGHTAAQSGETQT
jgi:hypothetical protein